MCPVFISRHSAIMPSSTNSGTIRHAEEPDYKTIITDAGLRRRMSRFVKMGVACGLQCIDNVPTETIDGIITATGLGCLADTEKFINSIETNNERLLNPTPFIQSTFNTVGGQIALLKGIKSYNVTYVNRGTSFESALIDAMMQIGEGAKNIVVGAIEEITPALIDIETRLGRLKNGAIGEGAYFFCLTNNKESGVAILDIDTCCHALTTAEVHSKVKQFLERNSLSVKSISTLINGDMLDRVKPLFTDTKIVDFKTLCGEFYTATAHGVSLAYNATNTNEEKYILVANSYRNTNFTLILLKK